MRKGKHNMKLETVCKAKLLTSEKKEASRDYGESYRIGIMQGSEIGTFPATKEAYEELQFLEPFKEYNFGVLIGEFKGEKTVRITSVFCDSAPKVHPAVTDNKPADAVGKASK